ncbi:Uncharacterized protein OS=Planctomyces maris DSM 8797 GN=PM8797T_31408 PE=4 SV=1: AAA_25 [Gemmataceae bacterium]|nr:Uncharacterized protein OS=Planctomyces maris DSM 8797 GN=PM8797T_31408 PE=4 SV=1: AAA_25 [Gemmataceae bacterium]VTU02450.1 Uncharacterized protein OS=Planctomyces maris DSM 8797 GN=PM8797T_31408 PE=4 SV=1: AAA_25 [Gemmataceae bacterium]
MPHDPPGGNPPLPDPADVPELLATALQEQTKLRGGSPPIRPALASLPGWPYQPGTPHAAAVAAALADYEVGTVEDVRNSREIAREIARSSIPDPPYVSTRDLSPEERAAADEAAAAAFKDRQERRAKLEGMWDRLHLSDEFRRVALRKYKIDCEEPWDTDSDSDRQDLVRGLLRSGRPMVIGGPEKSMKTSLSIDLAAALTTGTPFLGLEVPERVAVAVVTVETPRGDWKSGYRRALAARGFAKCPGEEPLVTAQRDVLRGGKGGEMFTSYLVMSKTRVVIIDPLYRLLPTRRTTDIVAVGRAIEALCKNVTDADAVPVVVHHMNKSIGEVPTLRDLSGAGVGAWFRSWLLVARASEYAGDKLHSLAVVAGSSRGDCSPMRVRFDEANWKITTRSGLADPPKSEPAKRARATGPHLLPTRK